MVSVGLRRREGGAGGGTSCVQCGDVWPSMLRCCGLWRIMAEINEHIYIVHAVDSDS